MSKTIWKYELKITDEQIIEMPNNAQILSVENQTDRVCLWALVNPNHSPVKHTIKIHGTGHPIENTDNMNFIGTVVTVEGAFVWHVFILKD